MQTQHTVEAALLALSSVDQDHATERNGVGFNGRDTKFGNDLAKQVIAGKPLSVAQYGTAYRMLNTYRTQLLSFDIDYSLIPTPDSDAAPKKTSASKAVPTVDFRGGAFFVSFPYALHSTRDDLKETVPGRIWSATAKAWIVPPDSAAQLGKFALRNGFNVTDAALQHMGSFVATPKSVPTSAVAKAKRIERETKLDEKVWKMSWADDADIDIEVPEGYELYGFQKGDIDYALQQLRPGKGVYFGDEMGLGKTPQSALVLREKKAYPAIIAMPRVVWLKWAKELQTWTPGLRVALLAGRIVTPKTILVAKRFGAEIVKLGQPLPDADVYLVKYSVLFKWTKPVAHAVGKSKHKKRYTATGPLKDVKAKGIVFDEAHYLKDESAQRTKAGLALTTSLDPDVRLALSGTPFLNRHKELLPMLTMLGRLPDVARDEWDFLNKYCNANGYEKQGPLGFFEFDASVNGAELNRKMRSRFYAQHEKLDRKIEGVEVPGVLNQLPPIIPDYVPAELKNQNRYDQVHADLKLKKTEYAKALRKLKAAVAGNTPKPQLTKMRGMVMGLENEVGVLSNEARKVCGEEKVEFSIEWIENWLASTDESEKLIVFGYHREVNETIAEYFKAPLIYGGQNEATRQDSEDAFQEDATCRLIVCQIEAASVGINLTAATAIAFIELPYRPGDLDQAIGRAYGRLNDVHGVSVYYLIYYGDDPKDPTIEEHILDSVLAPKRKSQRTGVSGGKEKTPVSA